MTAAERAIRWSTIAAVSAVAIVAGWVSYDHALAVVRAHGESGSVAWLYPGTIDGLIYSASMVLLDAARRQRQAPPLARWMLGAGIVATLAANIAAGLHFGPVGAIVAAWPALALVGSYELLMVVIRGSAAAISEAPADAAADMVLAQVAQDAETAAQVALSATIAAGNPLSGRQLADRFGLNRAQVARVQDKVRAAANGHARPQEVSSPA